MSRASAEREGERLDGRIKKFDLELSIGDRLRLADQLIQPLLDNGAVAAGIYIGAMGRSRRCPSRETRKRTGLSIREGPMTR
jgi:hypothetical protein